VENNSHTAKSRYLKSVLVVFFLLLTIKVTAPGFKFTFLFGSDPVNAYDRLIKAVIQVESSGDTFAYNLTEEAVGAFQIRPIRLLDFNIRTGSNIKLEDCYNYEISKKIFLYYANRIGFPDYESIARQWNGSGKTTLEYWRKIKLYL
jgi:hypothetical protein